MYIIFMLLSISAFAESLFYTPESTSTDITKPYNITHESYIETIIGSMGTQDGNNLVYFNRFQRARLNLQSLVEIEDTEKKHKAVAEIQIGTNANEDQSTLLYLNQGYIEVQNAESQPLCSKISFGLQKTAANSLAVNSSTIMKNNQGINGRWYRFIQMPIVNSGGGYNPTFMLQNSSLIAQGFGDSTFLYSTNNNILNYVQPSPNWTATNIGIGWTLQRINGLKVAFTYQPFGNSGNFSMHGNSGFDRRGITISNAGTGMFMKDIASLALNYLNEWRGIVLNTTFSVEHAGFRKDMAVVTIDRNKIKQYTVGVNLSYIGFTLGGSYSYAGQSLLIKPNTREINSYATTNASDIRVQGATTIAQLQNLADSTNLLKYKDTYNYDVGISYAFARYQVGLAYMKSRFMNNRANTTVFSLSEDLKAINGIKLATVLETGVYQFHSANYFQANNNVISIQKPNTVRGYFAYVGMRASL